MEQNADNKFKVVWKRKISKQLEKCPEAIKEAFVKLVNEIREKGPVRSNWQNFSGLGKNKYHCHLAYHWVACWWNEDDSIVVEVTYVGSRENAPY